MRDWKVAPILTPFYFPPLTCMGERRKREEGVMFGWERVLGVHVRPFSDVVIFRAPLTPDTSSLWVRAWR
jgi:hypothetical protein